MLTYTKGVSKSCKSCGHIGSQRMECLVRHHDECRIVYFVSYFFSQHLQPLKQLHVLTFATIGHSRDLLFHHPTTTGFYTIIFAADNSQLYFSLLPTNNILTKWSYMQMIIFVVGNLDESHLQHLKQIVVPVSYRNISPGCKCFDLVITTRYYFCREVSMQYVNSQREAHLLARPEYS